MVTLGGVIVTMFAGEPVTVSCTVMALLAKSQVPHPVVVTTERVCGELRVVREVGMPKPLLVMNVKLGVTTSISTVPSAQPVAEAVMITGAAVGATPETRNSALVVP